MVTIFLLWQLMAGVPADVDAFTSLDQCHEMQQALEGRLKLAIAQTDNDVLKQITIVGCQPVEVKVPAAL